MLVELQIKDLGVIADASIELSSGLTVVTGETGAGKTMVVTSLDLLRGQRARPDRVRHSVAADGDVAYAVVEGRYDLSQLTVETRRDAAQVLDEAGAQSDEDGTVIVSRTVRADGRSRAHLGGRTVPAGTLSQFAERQLTIHGQNDQLGLLRPERQRQVLDSFDETVAPLLDNYRRAQCLMRRSVVASHAPCSPLVGPTRNCLSMIFARTSQNQSPMITVLKASSGQWIHYPMRLR